MPAKVGEGIATLLRNDKTNIHVSFLGQLKYKRLSSNIYIAQRKITYRQYQRMQKQTSDNIDEALANATLLAHPYHNALLSIIVNVSEFAIGGVL